MPFKTQYLSNYTNYYFLKTCVKWTRIESEWNFSNLLWGAADAQGIFNLTSIILLRNKKQAELLCSSNWNPVNLLAFAVNLELNSNFCVRYWLSQKKVLKKSWDAVWLQRKSLAKVSVGTYWCWLLWKLLYQRLKMCSDQQARDSCPLSHLRGSRHIHRHQHEVTISTALYILCKNINPNKIQSRPFWSWKNARWWTAAKLHTKTLKMEDSSQWKQSCWIIVIAQRWLFPTNWENGFLSRVSSFWPLRLVEFRIGKKNSWKVLSCCKNTEEKPGIWRSDYCGTKEKKAFVLSTARPHGRPEVASFAKGPIIYAGRTSKKCEKYERQATVRSNRYLLNMAGGRPWYPQLVQKSATL